MNLRVKVGKGYFSLVRNAVGRGFESAFRVALSESHFGSVRDEKQCGMRSGQAFEIAHCARVQFIETADQQVPQDFWTVVCCDEVARMIDALKLFVDRRRAANYTVGLLSAQEIVVVQSMTEKAAARITHVAESGSACDQGICTESSEEIDRPVTDKAALCGSFAKHGSEKRADEFVSS